VEGGANPGGGLLFLLRILPGLSFLVVMFLVVQFQPVLPIVVAGIPYDAMDMIRRALITAYAPLGYLLDQN
jgi:hypothetical protein